MKKTFFLIFIFLNILNAWDFNPSFDCNNSKTNITEQYICNNEELSGWDRFMYDVYNFSYKKEENKAQLKNDQLNWIQERNNCKENYNCVEESYSKRVQILIDKYVEQQAIPDEYIYKLFKKYPIKDCSTINVTGYKLEATNKKYTNSKKDVCKGIKETIWNEKSMANLKIKKPIVQAKFFEDKKYRDFIHESIKRVNFPFVRGNVFPPSVFIGRDLMVLKPSEKWDSSGGQWHGYQRMDMCDLRIYKGEFDGNLENGEEYLHFVGASFTPNRYRISDPGNSLRLTIYNEKDKEVKLKESFIHDATTSCLGYKQDKVLSWFISKDKLSNLIVYDNNKLLFWKEWLKEQELWLQIVDERYRDTITTIIINRKGEVK